MAGGFMAFNHTEESKRRLSEMRKGEKNPFFGKKHKPEVIEAMRQRAKVLNAKRQYDLQPVSIKDVSETKWAYIAGLIDGEGSITIKKGQPWIGVYNCHLPLMEWLKQEVGGNYNVAHRNGREPNYCWVIGGVRNVVFLLDKVKPFLIIKTDAMEWVSGFLQEKYKGRQFQRKEGEHG